MVWIWLLFIIGLLVIAVLSMVTIHVVYSRVAEDDNFYVVIKALFGVIHFRYAVPTIKFEGLKKGFYLDREQSTNIPMADRSDHINIDRKDLMYRYEQFKILISHVLGFNRWLMSTLKRTHCTHISWVTNVGLDDAAETAVTIGMIWGLKTSILGMLFSHIKLEVQPHLVVYPHFNQRQFNMDLDCIIKIRLGYAMLAGLHLLVRIYKVKGGIRTWQNILSKA